jgi:hypothetical protein
MQNSTDVLEPQDWVVIEYKQWFSLIRDFAKPSKNSSSLRSLAITSLFMVTNPYLDSMHSEERSPELFAFLWRHAQMQFTFRFEVHIGRFWLQTRARVKLASLSLQIDSGYNKKLYCISIDSGVFQRP